jgi:large subunit ribosomal protein L9
MGQHIKVLLREHVDNLGRIGDVVRVRQGYARNFLMPRGLATEASEENVRLMARRRAKVEAVEAAQEAELAALAVRLAGARVSLSERADESGSLYGSVNAGQIAKLLSGLGHGQFDDKQVRLEAPLKSVGEHSVVVHIKGQHEATITVVVSAQA